MSLISSIKQWIKFDLKNLSSDQKAIEINPNGFNGVSEWSGDPDTAKKRINIVEQIEKVPGLKYDLKRTIGEYAVRYFIIVRNDIGQAIELYLAMEDDYADMELAEFIKKVYVERT